jgi:hypothetical protein
VLILQSNVRRKLEREVLETLRKGITRAKHEQRLTLLFLVEHPLLLRLFDQVLDEAVKASTT